MIDINKILSTDKKIQSITDSMDYINARLATYYNTEQERNDILRNIQHMELNLSNNNITNRLSKDQIDTYNETIQRAKSRLGLF